MYFFSIIKVIHFVSFVHLRIEVREKNSLCIQQDQALGQTTLKMKVVLNSHRELMVCKFVIFFF